jgi:hypothetical protein
LDGSTSRRVQLWNVEGRCRPQVGSSWKPLSYHVETGILYWRIGNPYPVTDGDNCGGRAKPVASKHREFVAGPLPELWEHTVKACLGQPATYPCG